MRWWGRLLDWSGFRGGWTGDGVWYLGGMIGEIHSVLELLETGCQKLSVLIVGDLMLDRYIFGEVDRISPEAPVPVLRHATRSERPGGAANVAMNVVGLGCKAYLCGLWGEDGEKAELSALLTKAGIDTSGMVTGTLPTVSKTRIVARTQQVLRLDIESNEPAPFAESRRLADGAAALVKKVQVVILSDYAKGALTREVCEAVIRAAREAGVPVLVDPKTSDFGKYSGATTVCPNMKELKAAVGEIAGDEDLVEKARVQIAEHEIGFLTVTMSERGIRVVGPEEDFVSPARAREVFDVSGAGDTVIATLAAGMAGGLDVRTSVELANLAAGIVVGKVGTVPVAKEELIAALTPSTGVASAEKVLDFAGVQRRVAEWRATGETVVFTNGCFDLLHVGHITLLEQCRRFGSKLVLGLNTDASVQRLKGPSRPIVGEYERARVMASLAVVDAVVLFDEDTPLELVKGLLPNVLVKGGDYTPDTVVGRDEVVAAGGRVEIVPTVAGKSTTNLVQKLAVPTGE